MASEQQHNSARGKVAEDMTDSSSASKNPPPRPKTESSPAGEKNSPSHVLTTLGSKVNKLFKNMRNPMNNPDVDDLREEDFVEVRFVNDKDISDKDLVPLSLRVAAGWAWRTLMVLAVMAVLVWLIIKLKVIVIPVLIAILFAVLLEPILRLLHLHMKVPRTFAAVITLLFGVGIVAVLLGTASSQLIASMGDVVEKARAGVNTMLAWFSGDPLNIDVSTVRKYWAQTQDELQEWLKSNSGSIASGALGVASTATSVISGLLITLFTAFFFLKDGRKIWQWVLRLVPVPARHEVNEAVIRGWVTLGSYARTQMAVAAIDALGIGLGAFFIINGTLALPIGVLVFLGSFIPIVGAITTGAIAVLVAVVTQGIKAAIWMLIVILVVQQVESNLLQPFMMSSAVSLHPVVVLLAVVAGGYLAGIIGAIFSVPLVAFVNTVVLYLQGHDKFLALNYDFNRSGGPPGSLEKEIAESLKPLPENLAEAAKMRQKAIDAGFIDDDEPTEEDLADKEVESIKKDTVDRPESDPVSPKDSK